MGTRYGFEILHQCGKRVKTESKKVLGVNSYVCRSYSRKTGKGAFLSHSILNWVNSKYYDINELNVLNNKENYVGILHLNIDSLKKHIDSLSNVLSMIKCNFPIIELSKHKLRSNSFINNISLRGYTFCYNETNSTQGGTGST